MPRNRSRVADIFTLPSRNHTARAFKALIRNSPAPPRIALYYNSSLFSVAFSALSISFRPILRQTELIVRLNMPQHLSFARTPRQTRSLAVLTRFFAPLCGDIPSPRAFRVLFARLPPSPRPLLPPNCRSTTRPDSFGSLYSRKRCRGAHFFVFSFHVEHTSCHPPKPQRLSGFLLVYAYLYIASLHVFAYAFAFAVPAILSPLSLRGWRSRLGAAPPLLFPSPSSPPGLAVFVGARLHSVFRGRAFLFFDFSISFCLMSMAHRNLFLFFSDFGFSRFPFEDPLRIFARL